MQNTKSIIAIKIAKIVLIIWTLLASIYVVSDLLKDYVANQAFADGQHFAVNQLIEQTKLCQPITVQSEKGIINVITLECLKQASQNQQTQEAAITK